MVEGDKDRPFREALLTTVPCVKQSTKDWDPVAVAAAQHGKQATREQHEAMCHLVDPDNSQSGLCMNGMRGPQGMAGAVGVIAGLQVTTLPYMKAGGRSEAPYVRAAVCVGSGVILTAAKDCKQTADSGDEG